jgi:hypothetical protein
VSDWRDTYSGPCPYKVGGTACKAGAFRHAGPHDWPARCKAYFRGRGLMIVRPGPRCDRPAGHGGQHECPRNGLGAPFTFRWGRA